MAPNENVPNVVRYCIAYVRGHRLGDIGIEDISKTLQQENTFVWLALHEPDATLLRRVQNQFDLHELAIDDALAAHQRPKLEQYGNQVFIVVKTAKLVDEQLQLGETHMFVGSRFFITVRHGPSTTYQSVRERLETTTAHLGKGPAMAAYGVLDFIVLPADETGVFQACPTGCRRRASLLAAGDQVGAHHGAADCATRRHARTRNPA